MRRQGADRGQEDLEAVQSAFLSNGAKAAAKVIRVSKAPLAGSGDSSGAHLGGETTSRTQSLAAGATVQEQQSYSNGVVEEPNIDVVTEVREREVAAPPRPMTSLSNAGVRPFPQIMRRTDPAAGKLRLGRQAKSSGEVKARAAAAAAAFNQEGPVELAEEASAANDATTQLARMEREIDAENAARLAGMSPAEIEAAQLELAAALSPAAIDAFRQRGRRKLGEPSGGKRAFRADSGPAEPGISGNIGSEIDGVSLGGSSGVRAAASPASASRQSFAADIGSSEVEPSSSAGGLSQQFKGGAAADEVPPWAIGASSAPVTTFPAPELQTPTALLASESDALVDMNGVELSSTQSDTESGASDRVEKEGKDTQFQPTIMGYSVAELVARCGSRVAAERFAALRALVGVLRRRRAAIVAGRRPAHARLPEMLPVAIRFCLEDQDQRVWRCALDALCLYMAPLGDETARLYAALSTHTGHHAEPPLLAPQLTPAELAGLRADRAAEPGFHADEGPWDLPAAGGGGGGKPGISDEEAARDCYVDCAKGMFRLLLLLRLHYIVNTSVSTGRLLDASPSSLPTEFSDQESAATALAAAVGASSAMVACLRLLVVMVRRSRFLAKDIASLPGLLSTVEQVCLVPRSAAQISAWSEGALESPGTTSDDNDNSSAAEAAQFLAETSANASKNRRLLALWGVRLLRVLCQSDRACAARVAPLLDRASGFLALHGIESNTNPSSSSSSSGGGGGSGSGGSSGSNDDAKGVRSSNGGSASGASANQRASSVDNSMNAERLLPRPSTDLAAVQVELLEAWRVCLTYGLDSLGAARVLTVVQTLSHSGLSSEQHEVDEQPSGVSGLLTQWALVPGGAVGVGYVRALHELVVAIRPVNRSGAGSYGSALSSSSGSSGSDGSFVSNDEALWPRLEAMAAAFAERLQPTITVQNPHKHSNDSADSVAMKAAMLHFVSAVLEHGHRTNEPAASASAAVAAAIGASKSALAALAAPDAVSGALAVAPGSALHGDFIAGVFRLATALHTAKGADVGRNVLRATDTLAAAAGSLVGKRNDMNSISEATAMRSLCMAHAHVSRLLLRVATTSMARARAASYMLLVVGLCGPGDEYLAAELSDAAFRSLAALLLPREKSKEPESCCSGALRTTGSLSGDDNGAECEFADEGIESIPATEQDMFIRAFRASFSDTVALRHSTALLAGLPAAVTAVTRVLPSATTHLPLPRQWMFLPLAGRVDLATGEGDASTASMVATCLQMVLRLERGADSDESGGLVYLPPEVKLYYVLLVCLQGCSLLEHQRVSAPLDALRRSYIRQCAAHAAKSGITFEAALTSAIDASEPPNTSASAPLTLAPSPNGLSAPSGHSSGAELHAGLVALVSDLTDAFAADSFGNASFVASLRVFLRVGFAPAARSLIWRSLGGLGLLSLLAAPIHCPTNDAKGEMRNGTRFGLETPTEALLYPPDTDPAMLDAYITALGGARFSPALGSGGGDLFLAACHHLVIYFFPSTKVNLQNKTGHSQRALEGLNSAAVVAERHASGGQPASASTQAAASWAKRSRFAALQRTGDAAIAAVMAHECLHKIVDGEKDSEVCGGLALPPAARHAVVAALTGKSSLVA